MGRLGVVALGAGLAVGLTAYALAVFDDGTGPALYAGGSFTTAGGQTVNRIGRRNGSAWSAVGAACPGSTFQGCGMNDDVQALAVFDDGTGPALYAGGGFVAAGGVTANNVARWDGSSWSGLGPDCPGSWIGGCGTSGAVHALLVPVETSGRVTGALPIARAASRASPAACRADQAEATGPEASACR